MQDKATPPPPRESTLGRRLVISNPESSSVLLERAMLKESKLRMVFLPEPFAREGLWNKVVLIMQWWPEIEKACTKLERGGRLVMKTKKGKLTIEPLERL